jgi:hypothetical protein
MNKKQKKLNYPRKKLETCNFEPTKEMNLFKKT